MALASLGPDTAAESWMLEVSVTELSPAFLSTWLKLHQILDMLCYGCHGPLLQAPPPQHLCALEMYLSYALVVPLSL